MTDAGRPDDVHDADGPSQGPDASAAGSDPREHPGHAGQGAAGDRASEEPGGTDEYDGVTGAFDDATPEDAVPDAAGGDVRDGDNSSPATDSAVQGNDFLEDLRRLQAEYVNYKRRVDRDRALATDAGVQQVVLALIPVLDDIHLAREHGDLGGPFEKISDKLEAALGKFGVTRLGEAGVAFDPAVHEALMHVEAELPEGASGTTVVAVLQPGWKVGDRVVRPARVSVADPA